MVRKASPVIDTRDNFDIIRDGLQRIGGRQKPAGDWHMILCPFHSERTPSCGVYMRRDDTRRNLGSWNCLGCGEHGNWNKLAEKANVDPIKEWDSGEKVVGGVITRADEDKMLGSSESLGGSLTLRSIIHQMGCPEAQPWVESINWRGFKGEFLAKVGGMVIDDAYNDNIAVLFPVKVGRRYVGAVKAIYEKKYKKQLGYITMKGSDWVNNYGLFPYNITQMMIRKGHFNFVILVEGPRDALRLIKHGIPALAVLGANTMGRKKVLQILNLGTDIVYAMPDNDSGGLTLWRNVKSSFTDDSAIIRRLKLPRDKDEQGKIIKMDPFNAPIQVIRNLKSYLKEHNNWKPYKI